MKQYKLVAVGGTFDRLHKGHKAFLRSALAVSDELVVGLTTDSYVSRVKKVSTNLSYETRKQELIDFFSAFSPGTKVTILPLEKNSVNSTWHKKIDAIAVTANTLNGAEEINAQRLNKDYSPLPIIVIPLQKAEDGEIISSTRIRAGLIDRNGKSYLSGNNEMFVFTLPNELRQVLKKPLGEIINTDIGIRNINATRLVTVGDITTQKFLAQNRKPDISIVDFVVERKTVFSKLSDLGFSGSEAVYIAENPPSHLNSEVFIVLEHIFKKNFGRIESVLRIIGEEDLTVIPVILLAPIGTVICYGQPKEGTVLVRVNGELKRTINDLLTKFDIAKK